MTMQRTQGKPKTVVAEHQEGEFDIQRVDNGAAAMLNKSDVQAQLDAAHRYPRRISDFLTEAKSLACLTVPVAESCIYTLPRAGKPITGPSVRLAEICMSTYGNLQVGARVLDADATTIAAQGVAWDMEKNVRVTYEAKRRITNKDGGRFNADMIGVTGNAAASIALRNAVFKIIPRALIDVIYAAVREVAVGNASTLVAKRQEVAERLTKMGVPIERVLARVAAAKLTDVGLAELETLIGLGTAVKNGDTSIDEAFPPGDDKPAREAKVAPTPEESKPAGPAANTAPAATERIRVFCAGCSRACDGETVHADGKFFHHDCWGLLAEAKKKAAADPAQALKDLVGGKAP